ncbi:hypothetical protein F975_02353 [Acinetobacter sp. ANC 3789]|uniref:pyocin activator PrtN family protein n=1 Tax=Acinetobacter sp. ANC 3789 TaxID=1217714 RepID=UPI0002CF34E1|nr:pyocin activator PrtN family protein [Acinetobacter sp. ANC 3789]ENU79724.1 hypothetical protein F975_02353 [Acinetobacter sp. ANC 3789]
MNKTPIKTSDYLFLQFRTITPTLEQVGAIYYSHLSKAKLFEKAKKMEFPFVCYKIDESQKSPYFVDIFDLAFVLEETYKSQLDDFYKITGRTS